MNTEIESNRRALGRLLRDLREGLGLNQIEAADRCGVSRQTWIKLEKATGGTTIDTIGMIASGLGTNRASDDYARLYKLSGFFPPDRVDDAAAAPTESRDLHDDALEEFSRTYRRLEGERWFKGLGELERIDAVRSHMEERRKPARDWYAERDREKGEG